MTLQKIIENFTLVLNFILLSISKIVMVVISFHYLVFTVKTLDNKFQTLFKKRQDIKKKKALSTEEKPIKVHKNESIYLGHSKQIALSIKQGDIVIEKSKIAIHDLKEIYETFDSIFKTCKENQDKFRKMELKMSDKILKF